MAQRPGVYPAPYRPRLAAQAVARSRATVAPAGEPWPARPRQGGARSHLHHVTGASHVGSAPDYERTPEARHRGGDIDRGAVAPATQATPLPAVEDFGEEPRAGRGRHAGHRWAPSP